MKEVFEITLFEKSNQSGRTMFIMSDNFSCSFLLVRHRDSRRESGNFNENNDKFSRYFVESFRKYGQLDIGEGRGGGAQRNTAKWEAWRTTGHGPSPFFSPPCFLLISRSHLYFECLRKTVVFGDAFFLLCNVRSDLASLNQTVMHDIFTRMVLCKRQFNHLSL